MPDPLVSESRAGPSKHSAKHPSRLPLHVEISEMLAREIKAGILLDGEKLEPERAMAQRLGIAVGTLRKALAVLHDQGMLERVQGSGNYVRNIDTDKTIYSFFRLELHEGGGLPSADIVKLERVKAAGKANFSDIGLYDRISRVRKLNDIPVALEEIWLDARYSPQPLSQESISESLYQFYKEHLGFWIARVEDSVSVATPPAWAPAFFDDATNNHWGFVERRSWDQLGAQAEYSKTWFDPALARYTTRFK